MKTSGVLPVTGTWGAPKPGKPRDQTETRRGIWRILLSTAWGIGGHSTAVRSKISYPTSFFRRQEHQLQRQMTKRGGPKPGKPRDQAETRRASDALRFLWFGASEATTPLLEAKYRIRSKNNICSDS